jgi:hypothetical protein
MAARWKFSPQKMMALSNVQVQPARREQSSILELVNIWQSVEVKLI